MPLPLSRAAISSVLCGASMAFSADRVVDYRYGIPTWHQPLGVPDDWHKPMADERGALLYDFGPGPYVQPSTRVELGAAGEPFEFQHQDFVDNARVPIMRSHLRRGNAAIEVTTFALPPKEPSASNGKSASYERLDGIAGALGWAKPAEGVSPEFRNVAWGVNRPLRYRVRVEPGAAKRVMLGFCESYKLRIGDRITDMRVEGAESLKLDIALNAELNQPQVFLFDGSDANRDGWLDVSIFSEQGHDPNTTLATIALFPAGLRATRAELVAGSLAKPDRAELRIACGTEVLQQEERVDVVHAKYRGDVQPALEIRTGRQLALDDDGTISAWGTPFVVTSPRASQVEQTSTGWRFLFPAGTREVTARVLSGMVDSDSAAFGRSLDLGEALADATAYWEKADIPYDRIVVADPAIQRMVDASIRTLYQARETIAGETQFNSSFSLYRGLWAGDAVYVVKLAAMLGDSPAGRTTLDALFSHQNEHGIIDELQPQKIFRTTAEVLWAVERDAQITDDWSYAKSKWPRIRQAVDGIRGLREETLKFPRAPYYGMLPPGFSDGGILDIGAEYSSVQCTITGLRAAARMATKLGHEQDAAAFQELAGDFKAAFDRNRQRDQRRDAHGNLYLPVRVGFKGVDPIPQLTQWAVLDTTLHGDWMPADEDLVRGTLALLASVEQQGIPVSMGWMPGGNWAGMGMFYAQALLVRGLHEKAAQILYDSANHASKVGTWVEEQSLAGDPLKLAGDQPHCFASAMFPQLVGSMLAHDHGGDLHLLASVPAEWLQANAENRLDGWQTLFGEVSYTLRVSSDGRSATLQIEPIKVRGNAKILLHTASLRAAGFASGQTAGGETIEVAPNRAVTLRFTR